MYSVNGISGLNFRGNGETTGSVAYRSNYYNTKPDIEDGGQDSTVKKPAETTGSVAYRISDQPKEDVVNFRGKEDDPQGKKGTPWLGILLGTAITGVVAIGAMGYAHKTNALSKLSDGFIKNTLTKCEPAMKTCHEWCASTKKLGVKTWETISGWFHKK